MLDILWDSQPVLASFINTGRQPGVWRASSNNRFNSLTGYWTTSRPENG